MKLPNINTVDVGYIFIDSDTNISYIVSSYSSTNLNPIKVWDVYKANAGKPLDVLEAVKVVCEQQASRGPMRLVADYAAPEVSRKIVRLVLSYTGYVKRTVWRQ